MATGDVLENLGGWINKGEWLQQVISGLAQNVRAAAQGNWTAYSQAVKENSDRMEANQRVAEAAGGAIDKTGISTKTAAEKAQEAADKTALLVKELAAAQNAATAAAAALDAMATAEAELAQAQVDAAQLKGELTGPEADKQRAKNKAEADRQKIAREREQQQAASDREKAARAGIEDQRVAADKQGPGIQDHMAVHAGTADEATRKAVDDARKVQQAYKDKLAELDASIAARAQALKTLDVKSQAVDVKEATEVGKAEKEAKKQANAQTQKAAENAIKSAEQAKTESEENSSDWKTA